MVWTPNRIVLTAPNARYDEGVSSGSCYPGMMLKKNSSGLFVPHSDLGGGAPLIVCIEDVKRGRTIKQAHTSGDQIPFYRPKSGELFLMLLQNGQNVTTQTPLMSAGDGTLISALEVGEARLFQIVAPSTTITGTNVETAFSNGSYTFPANSLAVGDRIHVRAKAYLIAVNSTNTHKFKLYLGATPVTIVDTGALSMIAADVAIIDVWITIRTITASGTIIADGFTDSSATGTFTHLPFTLVSSTLDSTVANPLTLKSTTSASSAGNQVRLDEFEVSLERTGDINSLVIADEAINNSGGTGTSEFNTAAFIRCMVK